MKVDIETSSKVSFMRILGLRIIQKVSILAIGLERTDKA